MGVLQKNWMSDLAGVQSGCRWVQYFDSNNSPYYYNLDTNDTQWDVPPEYAGSFLRHFSHFTAAHPTTVPEASHTEEVASTQNGTPEEGSGGWVEYYNESGAPYYYNHITGVNQWDMPEELKSSLSNPVNPSYR